MKSSGYSFCICTNGKAPDTLSDEIRSIRSLNMPAYEMLVAGTLPPNFGCKDIQYIPAMEAARSGRQGEMRNLLLKAARYDTVVFADDDLIFREDFYSGLLHFGDNFDVLCVNVLDMEGTRYWNWATIGGPRGHVLLDYTESDPFLYITGALCIVKSWVAECIQWNSSCSIDLQVYIDFTRRLQLSGFQIALCTYATVVHNDGRITHAGNQIFRLDRDLEQVADFYFSQSWEDGLKLIQRVFSQFLGDIDLKQRTNAIAEKYRGNKREKQNTSVLSSVSPQNQFYAASFQNSLISHIEYLRNVQSTLLRGHLDAGQQLLQQAVSTLGNESLLFSTAGVLAIFADLNQLASHFFERATDVRSGNPRAVLYHLIAMHQNNNSSETDQLLLSHLEKYQFLNAELNIERLWNFANESLYEAEVSALGLPAKQMKLIQKGIQAEIDLRKEDAGNYFTQALATADASELFKKSLQTRISFLNGDLKQEFPVCATSDTTIPAYVSRLCTSAEYLESGFKNLCEELQQPSTHFHRKYWEYYFVAKGLKAAGLMREGAKGICFGAGRENLISYFARNGCLVTATDLEPDEKTKAHWMNTNQHADSLADLLFPEICSSEQFFSHVNFQYADMNNIPEHLMHEQFDFIWSCCAFEHLGSIERGKQFIMNQMKCLKPGGIALHTTEFNVMSDVLTIDHSPTVLFRKCDIEEIAQQLRNEGNIIETDYGTGSGAIDEYVDIPPYMQDTDSLHLRLLFDKYIITSIGLHITKPS